MMYRYATEALGNIRTVKAFTTEPQEKDKYDSANDNALEKGIKDAFGGAGISLGVMCRVL